MRKIFLAIALIISIRAFSFFVEYNNIPKTLSLQLFPQKINSLENLQDTISILLENNGYPFYRIYTEYAFLRGKEYVIRVNIETDKIVYIGRQSIISKEGVLRGDYIDYILGNKSFLYKKKKINNIKKHIYDNLSLQVDSFQIKKNLNEYVLLWYVSPLEENYLNGIISYQNDKFTGNMDFGLKNIFYKPILMNFHWITRDSLQAIEFDLEYKKIYKIPFGVSVGFEYSDMDTEYVYMKNYAGIVFYKNITKWETGIYETKYMYNDSVKTDNGGYGKIDMFMERDSINLSFLYAIDNVKGNIFGRKRIGKKYYMEEVLYSGFCKGKNLVESAFSLGGKYPFYGWDKDVIKNNEFILLGNYQGKNLLSADIFVFENLFYDFNLIKYSYGMGLFYKRNNVRAEFVLAANNELIDYKDILLYMGFYYYFASF